MYRTEMKILKEKRTLLAEKEQATFDRFLDRCRDAYEDSFVGRFNNPFMDLAWQEQKNESPQQIVENPDESTPSYELKEIDPLELNKYSAD